MGFGVFIFVGDMGIWEGKGIISLFLNFGLFILFCFIKEWNMILKFNKIR